MRIMLIFGLHAMVVGSLFSRIAEIQQKQNLAEDVFGLTLMGIPLGVLTGSVLISRLVEAVGTRRTIMWSFVSFAATPLLVSYMNTPVTMFLSLICFGLTLTSGNIAMNVEADRIAAQTKTQILNRCHGSWGLGFLIVSSLGVLAIRLDISPMTHFTLLAAMMLIAASTLIRNAETAPPRRVKGEAAAKRFALPNKGTILIVCFALAGMWFEGTVRNWGVIYLRDGFGALDWHAALALPAMVLMQTIGRFAADGWIAKYGNINTARALTCISFLGLTVLVLTTNPNIALFGFALIGLGISTVFPQSISAAAQWGDRPASENVAAFSSLQTLVAFVAPPIIGFLAAWLDLRTAFMIFLPLPIVALWFARYLPKS